MDDNEDLKAIYAAARSIQSAAAQAVAELAQLVADNRAIPGQIAQQASRTAQDVPQLVKQSADQAQYAASKWKLFARVFRWQQLAIAVLAGIVIGGAGTWYFAYRPLKEAADYIIWLKESPAPRKDTPQAGADSHSHSSHGTKSKGSQESLPPTVDTQEREQP